MLRQRDNSIITAVNKRKLDGSGEETGVERSTPAKLKEIPACEVIEKATCGKLKPPLMWGGF